MVKKIEDIAKTFFEEFRMAHEGGKHWSNNAQNLSHIANDLGAGADYMTAYHLALNQYSADFERMGYRVIAGKMLVKNMQDQETPQNI